MKKFNFNIVENRKKFFLVPLVIIAITVIMLFVYGFGFGGAVNVGVDFTGGYQMRVQLGNKLTDETQKEYEDKIVSVIENLKDDNGESYGIVVEQVEKVGDDDTAAINVLYKGVGDDAYMTEVVDPAIEKALEKATLIWAPESVNFASDSIVAKYGFVLNGNVGDLIVESLKKVGVAATGYTYTDANTITVALSSAVADQAVASEALEVTDKFAGQVGRSGYTSSVVSTELLTRAFIAVLVAVVLMFIYILIRFESLSGIAAIFALVHDIAIMMCGMIIFHIPFNQTIVAALITILGYSINNTIIIFDRIRELKKTMPAANNGVIVNNAVEYTMSRTILTTITTLIMIVLVAIIGVTDIRIFALPIIFGLLAGFFSANFLAPPVWAWLSDNFSGRSKKQTK